jgi:hypothetical protein
MTGEGDGARRPGTGAGTRRHALPLLVLLLVATAPFATCLLRGETPFFLDLADHWYPFRLHAHLARQDGEIAHWCRRAFCGFPFLAQAEAGLAYPPHWVLDLVHPAKTLLGQVIGHRFVLGALLYAVLVARGMSRTAATVGGALVIASGLTMACFTQIAVLRTLAWLPLLLLGAWRLTQGRRLEGLLWTALGTGLTLVAGYPPFLQRAALALPFLYLLDGSPSWQERGMRFLCAAGGALLGVGMAAAQLLPTMLLTSVSQRQLGLDPALLDAMRVEPLDALMLVAPRLATNTGIGRQGFAYLGALALALAALAVVRRRPGAVAFAVAAGAALVASMGRAVPLVGDLLASLPMAGSFRNPGQYLVAWILVVPVLVAMGLDAWRERRPTAREAAGVLGGVAALLLVAVLVPTPIADRASLVRAGIGAAGLAVGVAAWLAPTRIGPCLLVAACLADAGSFLFAYPTKGGRARPVASLLVPDEPFAVVARRHREMRREGTPRAITSEAVFNWENHGWVAGVDDVRGLVSLLPMHALDMNRIVAEGVPFPRERPKEPLYAYGPTKALDSPRIDLLAVQYAIGFAQQPGPEWRAIGEGVWERDAVPEARLAWRAVSMQDDPIGRLTRYEFDLRREVVVAPQFADEHEALGGAAPGTVHILEIHANEVAMDVHANRPATLLWAQTTFPGWTVTVGGVAQDWAPANFGHMAVRVPAGRSRVVWRFATPGWGPSLRISILACWLFVLLAMLPWLKRLRQRRSSSHAASSCDTSSVRAVSQ